MLSARLVYGIENCALIRVLAILVECHGRGTNLVLPAWREWRKGRYLGYSVLFSVYWTVCT